MYIAYIVYYYICLPLCVHILYFDAAKFSIKQFSLIYFTVSAVRKWNDYEKGIETRPIKTTNKKVCNQAVWGTIDFHIRKKYYWSQWCPRTALFPTFFRISSFVFSRTKAFIKVCNYWVSKWWQNLYFWVNCPFKTPSLLMLMLLVYKINYCLLNILYKKTRRKKLCWL